MAVHQGFFRNAFVKIIIGGHDVTDRLHPYLIAVRVTLKLNGNDEVDIELDDRDAELEVPPNLTSIDIWMGWNSQGPGRISPLVNPNATKAPEGISESDFARTAQQLLEFGTSVELGFQGVYRLLFSGVVNDVESGFNRKQGGRRMWIKGGGRSELSKAKEQRMNSWGTGAGGPMIPLSQVVQDSAKGIGLDAKIAGGIGSISRDYWFQNSSFTQFVQNIASEVGAYVRFRGDGQVIMNDFSGRNIDGTDMRVVDAVWGINLIAWRIRPFPAPPQFKGSKRQHFGIQGGIWNVAESSGGGGDMPFGRSLAIFGGPNSAPNAAVADQVNGGADTGTNVLRGTGWVTINGHPFADAGVPIRIDGARPGVNATYTIQYCEHMYSRRGYTTTCHVQEPRAFTGQPFRGWPRAGQQLVDDKEKEKAGAAPQPSPRDVAPPVTVVDEPPALAPVPVPEETPVSVGGGGVVST